MCSVAVARACWPAPGAIAPCSGSEVRGWKDGCWLSGCSDHIVRPALAGDVPDDLRPIGRFAVSCPGNPRDKRAGYGGLPFRVVSFDLSTTYADKPLDGLSKLHYVDHSLPESGGPAGV